MEHFLPLVSVVLVGAVCGCDRSIFDILHPAVFFPRHFFFQTVADITTPEQLVEAADYYALLLN